jgi:RNA recognition motif-containing protein
MTKKLFVASLPFEFSDEQLRALFAEVGPVVEATMVMDRKHGRTRGFGFVTMGSDADSDAAMEKLNGTMVGERKIWVTEARPRAEDTAPARPPKRRRDGPSEGDPRPFRSSSRDFGGRPQRGFGGGRPHREGGGAPRRPFRDRPQPQEPSNAGFPDVPPSNEPRRPFGRSGRSVDPYNPNPYSAGQGRPPQRDRRPGGPPRRGGRDFGPPSNAIYGGSLRSGETRPPRRGGPGSFRGRPGTPRPEGGRPGRPSGRPGGRPSNRPGRPKF